MPSLTRRLVACALLAYISDAKVVPVATFDDAKETTWPWQTVNDPVMGGQSNSTFHVDAGQKLGVWQGQVRIVPFLKAPGFCNLQAPGLYKTAAFPDLSGTGGIIVKARESSSQGLTRFNVMLMTKGAKHLFKQGVYTAALTLTGDMVKHFVPWDAFKCSWRGQNVSWCPEIPSQLAQVTNIGLGTFFPGVAGAFRVEVASISAGASAALTAHSPLGAAIDLATFTGDKATQHRWKTESDPVMGGQSESKFEVKEDYGEYSGTCRIVPKLKAPGFTIALTETPLVGSFPDVSAQDGIILGLRNMDANITDFKFAFCDSRVNYYRCQFQSYKADFKVPAGDSFMEVFLPWSKFSDKWSAYTGEHTAEEPPKASSLKSITQLQLWTEGVAGHFRLQIKYVRAGKTPADQGTTLTYV